MMTVLTSVRNKTVEFTKEVGDMVLFLGESLRLIRAKPSRFPEIIQHMEFIGNQSIGIIMLTSLFTGLALSLQIYLGFKIVNMANLVGPTVALGVSRELGPVLTGLIVAARAGGAMAARLGTMRVNEQIDALDVMGVNTKQYLITPRIIAAVLCMPLLTAVFDFVAMVGCWFLCVYLVDLDEAVFFSRINDLLELRHIMEGLFKSAIFGLIFAVVCTYRGFFTTGGARGVGEATNRGVVLSMVLIIVLDYFLSSLIRIFYISVGITG
ncbi:MAG: ABC transporter permease [Bdellovibrionaceae bacterium]|nr:ABC transporter permease [Pseudobdellovibrionaceae bacterium]